MPVIRMTPVEAPAWSVTARFPSALPALVAPTRDLPSGGTPARGNRTLGPASIDPATRPTATDFAAPATAMAIAARHERVTKTTLRSNEP